jgi:DNA-binding PucR family transcriptional regulator
MIDKVMTAAEATALIQDGDVVGLQGGPTQCAPMTLVREIIRAELGDLQAVTLSGGIAVDWLAAAGCLSACTFAAVTMEHFGLCRAFRRHVEAGAIAVEELSETALFARLGAAARGHAERAESRLGYRLNQAHTAAVIWSDEPNPDPGALQAAAEAVMRSLAAHQRLTVIASAGTVWMWTGAPRPPQAQTLAAIPAQPGIRVAVGTRRPDLDGFRRSHLEAVASQRMLTRLGSTQRLATFDEIQLVALATTDPDRAEEFVQCTLGDLAGAAPEIPATVRAYLQEQSNVARAASALHAHRNTVLRRLTRAEQLLPRPLAESAVQVAVALDILYWRG